MERPRVYRSGREAQFMLRGCEILILAGLSFGQLTFGQYAPQRPATQETGQQALSPDQLDNLIAPIALYPDTLLSQVLAASTYPLEIVEAQQWLQQHPDLRNGQLIDDARQTNWDPSVQALVAFPDVLAMLNRDVQWTTDLGNAFLGQQSDVLDAIQRMRAAARQNGRLASTPQQVVSNDAQVDPRYGQGAIQIQPADPQVMYVPAYNPEYIWGPPPVGAYPALGYPSDGYGLGFGVATLIGSLFTGLLSFGGWGWGVSWLTHSLLLNGLFLSHFGFGGGGFGGGGFGYSAGFARSYSGATVWAHSPAHRLGVPYSNESIAHRFGGSYGVRSAGSGGYRGAAQPTGNWRSFGFSDAGSYGGRSQGSYESRGAQAYGGSMGFRNDARGYAAPAQSYRGSYASPSGSSSYRSYGSAAPSWSNSAPRGSSQYSSQYSSRSYAPSAPRSSGHFSVPHFSAPRSSGSGHSSGHSSAGHSGGHSGGGHRR
jgi:hypothetical protein